MASSNSHEARKALFRKGIQQGFLTLADIDAALPPETLSPADRWLLFYSLRASEVEIREWADPTIPQHALSSPG